jgi:hypothetical protein
MFESFEGLCLALSLAGPLAVPRLRCVAAYNKHHTKQPTETKPTRNKLYCWFVYMLLTVVVPMVPFLLQSDEYVNLVNILNLEYHLPLLHLFLKSNMLCIVLLLQHTLTIHISLEPQSKFRSFGTCFG